MGSSDWSILVLGLILRINTWLKFCSALVTLNPSGARDDRELTAVALPVEGKSAGGSTIALLRDRTRDHALPGPYIS